MGELSDSGADNDTFLSGDCNDNGGGIFHVADCVVLNQKTGGGGGNTNNESDFLWNVFIKSYLVGVTERNGGDRTEGQGSQPRQDEGGDEDEDEDKDEARTMNEDEARTMDEDEDEDYG